MPANQSRETTQSLPPTSTSVIKQTAQFCDITAEKFFYTLHRDWVGRTHFCKL